MKDPWRYRCPRGHSSWHHRQSEFVESESEYYCEACGRYHDDPHFNQLQDMKV